MTRWSHAADAPVQLTGTVWSVRSPRDAWHLLSPALTRDDIERFRAAITNVLGLADPSLDLPAEKRWLAAVHSKEFPHSSWLRRGLGQTIIQISLTSTIAGYRGSDIGATIVGQLLDGDWQRWYALSPLLPLLAEAAPATFLSLLENQLDRDAAGLAHLFAEDGLMHPDHASGLLCALKVLAWYPEHLTRAALLLARLAREHKQPSRILRAMFLTWRPQTASSVEDRTAALRVVLEREPNVGWALLMELWPKSHDVGSHHLEPQWRERPIRGPVTIGEYNKAVTTIINLALDSLNNDTERLFAIIKQMGTAPCDARVRLRDALVSFAANEHDKARRAAVWNGLRQETNNHRQFHHAAWALPEAELALFDPVLATLTPEDLVLRHAWLFQDAFPTLPIPGADHRSIEAALADLRPNVVAEIVAARGTAGLRDLARAVQYPFLLGTSCADVDEGFMLGLLASPEERLQLCGMGYVSQRHRRDGMAWADQVLGTNAAWDRNTRTAFLLALPTDRQTWDRGEAQGVTAEYWERTRVFLGGATPPDDIAYALSRLLNVGQIGQAFEQAAMTARDVPTALLVQTLDGVLQALQDPQPPFGHLTGYYVVQILGALDARADADLGTIARFEWAFLPLLREERNLRLHEHLSNAPELFAQMIQSIYPPPGPHPDPTEEEVARAHHAFDLLHSWHTIPGTTPDGTIDREALFGWADAARAACGDRRDACDDDLGKVLAWSPKAADGLWPHESVRALIEHMASPALEDGFCVGVFNKRGIVTRDPLGGGTQERALAARYREGGQRLAAASPRTAAVLLHIADRYESEAHREDVRAAHLRLRQ